MPVTSFEIFFATQVTYPLNKKKSKSLLLLLHMCPFQYFYVRFCGILSSFKAFLAEIHFSKEICIFWIIGNLLAMYRAFSCEFTGYFIHKTHCTKSFICLEKLCSINLVMVKGNAVFFSVSNNYHLERISKLNLDLQYGQNIFLLRMIYFIFYVECKIANSWIS